MQWFFALPLACLLGLPAAPQSSHGTRTVKLSGPLVREIEGDVQAALLSPDGSRAVYRASASSGRVKLFSVPTDGSEPAVQLSANPSNVGTFRISADGGWVLYADAGLLSVPIDGSLPPLALSGGSVVSILPTPDSSRVVFEMVVAGKRRLHAAPIHAAGSAVELSDPIVQGSGVQQYEISADSSLVVYRATTTTADAQLWSVPIDRSTPPQMLNPPLPVGRSVADFELVAGGATVIYRANQDAPGLVELYAVPAAGGPAVKLNDPPANVSEAHASADGAHVVYLAGDLFSVPLAGGTPAFLATAPQADFLISPDSTRVVYHGLLGSLFGKPIQGGSPSAIGSGAVKQFAFSPDGARVLYRAGTSVDELFTAPAAGGAAVKLSPPTTAFGVPSFVIEADSARVAFLRAWVSPGLYEVWSAPLDGALPAVQLSPVAQASRGAQSLVAGAGLGLYVGDFEQNEAFQLYAVPLDGSAGPVRVNGPLEPGPRVIGDVNEFVVAPRGGRAAYFADQEIDERFESFSAPVDGGPTRRIGRAVPDLGYYMRPMALAPDGSFAILLGSGGGTGLDLFRASLDGSEATLALTGPSSQDESVLGPVLLDATGTHVVYGTWHRLWSVPADGSAAPSELSPLVSGNGFENAPENLRLSADGTRAVFVLDRQYTTGFDSFALYSAPLDGSQPAVRLHPELPSSNAEVFHFALTPDSTRVVFSARLTDPGPIELYSSPIDGSASPLRISLPLEGHEILVGAPAAANEFQVAPDGRSVVYIARSTAPGGKYQLYAVPIDGGAGVRLNGRLPSGGDTLAFEPFCSPDVGCHIAGRFLVAPGGRRVVYRADQRVDQRFELFTVELPVFHEHARDARPPRSRPLFAGSETVNDFQITPDGSTLVFLAPFDGSTALYRVPLEGGTPVRLTGAANLVGGDGGRASFVLSPDGASALFLADLESTYRYELFDVALDLSHPPRALNGPLAPNGDVRPGFRFGQGGRVFYLADQERDEVFELYATGARPIRSGELR